MLRNIWLHIARLYWKARADHARQFAASLERTIYAERVRAQEAVIHSELMLARADVAIAGSRSRARALA